MPSIYKSTFLILSATLVITTIITPAATAQDPGELIKCRTISDKDTRLACYDQYVEKLTDSIKTQPAQIKALPAAAPKASGSETKQSEQLIEAEVEKRVAARLKAKAIEEKEKKVKKQKDSFGKTAVEETPKLLTATVKTVKKRYDRGALILLDNGQIWEQIDGPNISTLKAGKKVTIERSTFGSYFMSIEGKSRSFSVKRKK